MPKNKHRSERVTHIRVDPYDIDLYLITDREAYASVRSAYNKEPIDLSADAGCSSEYLRQGVHLVGVFNGKVSTLVHELGHVTINILEWCGVPINSECSEAFCYLQDHLFSKCRPIVKRNRHA